MNRPITRSIGFADDATASRPGLQHCVEAALHQSEGLIDKVLDGLVQTVSRAHPASGGADPASPMGQVIQHLQAQRATLRASFAARLREAMYGGVKSEVQAQPLLRFDDLQLLEEDQLDENIEAAWAQQEIAMAVEDVLPPLDALVSTLLGWITVQPQLNPLRPEVFVRALRGALVEQIPDNEIRGALMTPAAGRLGVDLRKLYRELTDWLRSQGIEPAGPPGSLTQAQDSMPREARANVGVGSSVARTILTLDRLRKLLSGELDYTPPSGGGQDFLYTIPASLDALHDMKMVESMMQRLAKRRQEGAPAAQTRRKVDSKQIGKHLGEEVIRLMLETLLQDERLMLKVRQLVQALEPVMLRLVQTEPRFFSEKQHPARQLLDRITHRSLGFTSEHDEGFPRFLRTVEQAVAALRDVQVVSSGNFAHVLKILEDAWSRLDKVQKLKREEAAKALLHAEQRNLLAQNLAREFMAQIPEDGSAEVPEFVVDFLRGPWAQAVAESQLTYTEGADNDYLALVGELIWSVQPRVARRNRTRLVELVPSLLARLRQGLQLISYPPEMTSQLLDQLIELHEAALEGARSKRAELAPQDGLRDEGPDLAEVPWMASHEAQESGFLDEDSVMPMDLSDAAPETQPATPPPAPAGELSTGSWVELMLEGSWVRAQLTWVSPHHTLFMFISGGSKAHSMSRRTLTRLRTQGLLRLVSDGHLVEHALDAVAQVALRNSLDKAGG